MIDKTESIQLLDEHLIIQKLLDLPSGRHITYVHSKFEVWTLQKLKSLSEYIGLDLDIQSNERWNDSNFDGYFRETLSGRATNPFHLVDLKSCLENSKDQCDVKFYQLWLNKGFLYLILDGNNRKSGLIKYFNNKSNFTGGIFYSPHYKSEYTIKLGNSYTSINDFSKDCIDNQTINIILYTESTRSDLSLVFIALNSGVPLNTPEKLNSFISKSSNKIRELVDVCIESNFIAKKQIKGQALNRRTLDYFIAKLAVIDLFGINDGFNVKFDYNTMSTYYTCGSIFDQRIDEFVDRFKSFYSEFVSTLLPFFKTCKLQQIIDAFLIYRSVPDIKDRSIVWDKYIKLYEVLSTDTITKYQTNKNRVGPYTELYRNVESSFLKQRVKAMYEGGILELKYMYDIIEFETDFKSDELDQCEDEEICK